MAYDKHLAQRVREILREDEVEFFEQRMFGSLAFSVRGNLACGVSGDSLFARVGLAAYAEALARPHTAPFPDAGRPMRGWVLVAPDGCRTADELEAWVRKAVDFVVTLPPK
jgi:hypothetical protein